MSCDNTVTWRNISHADVLLHNGKRLGPGKTAAFTVTELQPHKKHYAGYLLNFILVDDATWTTAEDRAVIGMAVSMLVQCWEHGEQLRRWHNLETQIGDEGEKANALGGALNPAVLNI